ncbi:MAG TPA: efflux RND transporter periplasmic adaptor subunit [Vicinamibacterales bacterium]|nr:efflux RND transporter periplasmic adaptor subunit [Vicinamibacterales bacterium]
MSTVTLKRLAALTVVATLAWGCSRTRTEAEDQTEPPMLDVTSWTDKTELFMEYPPLVAAQNVRFAVHLTKMNDFSALNAGRPRIEMTPEQGGSAVTLAGSDPLRPGAFRVEGQLPAAGRYRWALLVEAPGLADRHDLGTATVFGDSASAVADAEKHGSDDPAAIAYLKEQQWTNAFATVPVGEVDMRMSVRAPATVHPLPGGEAIVAAPAAGRLMADVLPSIGDRVQSGQVLARLEPRLSAGADRATLEAEVAEVRAAVEAARVEQARAEQLLAERAVPARRVEDARRATGVAEARLRAAEARLAQRDETLRTGGGAAAGNAFALRAPIGGRLAEVMATLGASYDEGASLFRIVRTDRVELEVQVPAADVAIARQTAGLALEIPGFPKPLTFDPHHVHHPGVLDATTRALPLQMEIANPGEQLLIGQIGTAILYTRDRQRAVVVPSAAVLTEAGRPYVFVQTGGEQFARRFIEIAARDGDLVGIKSGVKPGERVVTRGAYEIQLASAAKGLPAEGHVH